MKFHTLRNAATLLAAFCLAALSAPAPAQAPVRDAAAKPAATPAPAPLVPPAAPLAAFANIGDHPAIVYDAPSAKANKTFLFGPHRSVEVLVKLDKMVKVRDAEGTVGWVDSSALGGAHFVEVNVAAAEIRAMPAAAAALVFEAGRGVQMEATGPATEGWLPVKHRDGQSGFVKATQVFGE